MLYINFAELENFHCHRCLKSQSIWYRYCGKIFKSFRKICCPQINNIPTNLNYFLDNYVPFLLTDRKQSVFPVTYKMHLWFMQNAVNFYCLVILDILTRKHHNIVCLNTKHFHILPFTRYSYSNGKFRYLQKSYNFLVCF